MLHGQLAGLHFGEVQNVVDDAQQVLARVLNLAQKVTLGAGQLRLQHQVREADDGIHGGADFVAHIGQKVGLDARCVLCRQLGVEQLGLGLFLQTDVLADQQMPILQVELHGRDHHIGDKRCLAMAQ